MLEKNVRHLLVVNSENNTNNNKPGIITPLDLFRYSTDDHSKEEGSNIIETMHHILDYYR
jgi:hypothetical protein